MLQLSSSLARKKQESINLQLEESWSHLLRSTEIYLYI